MFLTLNEAQDKLGYSRERFFEVIMCGALQPYLLSSSGEGCTAVKGARAIAELVMEDFNCNYDLLMLQNDHLEEAAKYWRFRESDCDPSTIRIIVEPENIDERRCVIIRKALTSLSLDSLNIRDTDKQKIRKWCQHKDIELFVSPTSNDGSLALFKRAWRYGRKKGYWSDGH